MHPPRPTYFEAMSGMLNHGWAPLTGALVGRDKWIDLPIAERYDLANDPSEHTNLAGRSPERDRELSTALGSVRVVFAGTGTEDRRKIRTPPRGFVRWGTCLARRRRRHVTARPMTRSG